MSTSVMKIEAVECRRCGQFTSSGELPKSVFRLANEAAWIIPCDHCGKAAMYRDSEIHHTEILWGPPLW